MELKIIIKVNSGVCMVLQIGPITHVIQGVDFGLWVFMLEN